MSQSNFAHLNDRAPVLAELGAVAERLFPFDPASSVVKLRLFAEILVKDIAVRVGVTPRAEAPASQVDLLRAIDGALRLDPQVRQLFHVLR